MVNFIPEESGPGSVGATTDGSDGLASLPKEIGLGTYWMGGG